VRAQRRPVPDGQHHAAALSRLERRHPRRGQGKRMHSDLPKVLHPLAGKAPAGHVLDTARESARREICVVTVTAASRCVPLSMRRTWPGPCRNPSSAPAMRCCRPAASCRCRIAGADFYAGAVWRRAADPRLDPAAPDRSGRQRQAGAAHRIPRQSRGYGRIVRVNGKVTRIVEEKDADDAERAIREINTGILVAPTAALARWLPTLGNRNAQGEYYLTDIVAMAVARACRWRPRIPMPPGKPRA
jgi:bifunctional UDP-N-acetylglucosamine pyrophosphorylase/glucosamine-1-phosphate N-acetyltransferase